MRVLEILRDACVHRFEQSPAVFERIVFLILDEGFPGVFTRCVPPFQKSARTNRKANKKHGDENPDCSENCRAGDDDGDGLTNRVDLGAGA